MPDNRRWTEAQCPAFLLQSPTDVHVIPRHAELRVETADGLERRNSKRHVAPRDVLRLAMRQQHVDRPAGRMGNAIGYQSVAGRRNVRTTHARETLPDRVQKSRDEVR